MIRCLLYSTLLLIVLATVSDGFTLKKGFKIPTFSRLRAFFQRLFLHRSRQVRKWKRTQFEVCHNPYNSSELQLVLKIKSKLLAKNRSYLKHHQQCHAKKGNFESGKSRSYFLFWSNKNAVLNHFFSLFLQKSPFLQKQPPEVFCRKKCSEKFCKFHRKTPVLESLFNKVASLHACNFIKKRFQ